MEFRWKGKMMLKVIMMEPSFPSPLSGWVSYLLSRALHKYNVWVSYFPFFSRLEWWVFGEEESEIGQVTAAANTQRTHKLQRVLFVGFCNETIVLEVTSMGTNINLWYWQRILLTFDTSMRQYNLVFTQFNDPGVIIDKSTHSAIESDTHRWQLN